jgi:hypothetical protein
MRLRRLNAAINFVKKAAGQDISSGGTRKSVG